MPVPEGGCVVGGGLSPGVVGRPRCQLLCLLGAGLEPQPSRGSELSLCTTEATARWAPPAGAWPGCTRPGTARRPSLEKPGPSQSLWSSGLGPVENKTSVSTSKLSEERGQGGTGGAVPAPRPQAASQREVTVTSSHHHTAGGTSRATAGRRGQTAQPGASQPGQDRSRAVAPCACGLARGHRYLMRFSTEYTDM